MSHVLLVDDDEDMVRMTERWFKKDGYEVETALSGQEALVSLAVRKPDLIVLDYAMPGMDGCQTFQAIRGEEAFRDIPVIFRTGNDDEGVAGIMEQLGPDGVVPKSEGRASLMQAAAGILNGRFGGL